MIFVKQCWLIFMLKIMIFCSLKTSLVTKMWKQLNYISSMIRIKFLIKFQNWLIGMLNDRKFDIIILNSLNNLNILLLLIKSLNEKSTWFSQNHCWKLFSEGSFSPSLSFITYANRLSTAPLSVCDDCNLL